MATRRLIHRIGHAVEFPRSRLGSNRTITNNRREAASGAALGSITTPFPPPRPAVRPCCVHRPCCQPDLALRVGMGCRLAAIRQTMPSSQSGVIESSKSSKATGQPLDQVIN